jgi:deoxyribonuclease IV
MKRIAPTQPRTPAHPPRFGAHMSIAGGHHKGVRSAHRIGFAAVQLFTKSTNQWRAKPLADDDIAACRQTMAETGITDPVGHNSYLINLGTPDTALWKKSIDAMTLEVERGHALGMTDLVIHPGAHVGSGEAKGLARIAKGINEVHRRTRGVAIKIDLETTAGQGSCLGHRFEHLTQILDLVAEPDRLGSAATRAIFSPRATRWEPGGSTMRLSMRWTGPSASAGSGCGI